MRWKLWIPLAIFLIFVGLAAFQLTQPKDDQIPSQMVTKPLPEFDLPPATPAMPGASRADLLGGKPKLLNICCLLYTSPSPRDS